MAGARVVFWMLTTRLPRRRRLAGSNARSLPQNKGDRPCHLYGQPADIGWHQEPGAEARPVRGW